MTPLTVFASLFRALSGGRYRSAKEALPRNGAEFELLRQLDLLPAISSDVLALMFLHPHSHYRHFTKPKKDGGRREIAEPDSNLKRIQHAILGRYFQKEKPHPAAIAYRAKKSIAHHVWPHAGAELLITADVADFFPSTTAGRVEDWWRERVDSRLAPLLTQLTTHRGSLPQGAPTSPGLSNFVNREMDERLARRALAASARYTRYCDDMVFSWRRGDGPPSDFENGVRATLHEFGYLLHPKKGWRLHERRDEPEITGVILTRHGRVRLPDRARQKMRRLRRGREPGDADRLAGYVGYWTMIRKPPPKAHGPQ